MYSKLYGYRSASNCGKYNYNVKGPLDSISAISYEVANLIVREGDFPFTQRYLEDKISSYRSWRGIPNQEEAEKLELIPVLLFVTQANCGLL